jgi:hypothetical protein
MAPSAAIVYLIQGKHSSYGGNQLHILQDSLRLLHENYNAAFMHDVLLFHTGEFSEAAQQERVLVPIADASRSVRFVRVPDQHWRLPLDAAPHLATSNRSTWYEYPRALQCSERTRLLYCS